MAERHEQLPDLPENTPTPTDPDRTQITDEGQPDHQHPKPVDPVNQWKLLKIIAGRNHYALADLRWLFQLDNPQDPLIQKPLGQLLRAGRIKPMMGVGSRTGQIGVVYVAQGDSIKSGDSEPEDHPRSTRRSTKRSD